MNLRIVLIEDSRQVREALSLILNNSPGYQCVEAFPDAEQALARFPQDPPDVALVDINLPGMSGIECVRHLKARAPRLEILMLTIETDAERVFQSLAAGASGYLVKNVPPSKLLEAIDEVVRGGAPMSGPIARLVVRHFREAPPPVPSDAGGLDQEARPTAREREILDLIAQGLRTKEIGTRLGISPQTVQTHVRNIYEKLHVRSRTEAVLRMRRPATPPAA